MPSSVIRKVEAHPAPLRERVRLGAITFITVAPPVAWSVHLLANYAFSSHACYPAAVPLAEPASGTDWLRWVLIAVDLAAIVICVLAAAMAFRSWTISAQEFADSHGPLMEAGEGRTRFLSIWGVLISLGFAIATIFDLIGLWIIPICG